MDDQWFYGQDGTQRGPIDFVALKSLATLGQLRPHDLVWRQGMPDWLPASQVMPELFAAAAPPIAQAPPSPFDTQPADPQPAAPPPPTPVTFAPPPFARPLGYETPLYDTNPQNGRAITALVLGILALPMCACPVIGIGFGIAAIVLGLGVKEGPNKGLAIGGIVCGGLGILLGLPQSGMFFYRLF